MRWNPKRVYNERMYQARCTLIALGRRRSMKRGSSDELRGACDSSSRGSMMAAPPGEKRGAGGGAPDRVPGLSPVPQRADGDPRPAGGTGGNGSPARRGTSCPCPRPVACPAARAAPRRGLNTWLFCPMPLPAIRRPLLGALALALLRVSVLSRAGWGAAARDAVIPAPRMRASGSSRPSSSTLGPTPAVRRASFPPPFLQAGAGLGSNASQEQSRLTLSDDPPGSAATGGSGERRGPRSMTSPS